GLITLTSVMLTVLNMIPAFLSQFVLDQVLAKKDTKMLTLGIIASIVISGWIGVVSWLRAYYMNFLSSRFDFAAGSAFMRKLLSLPFDFFATRHIGDFTRRLNELSRVRTLFTNHIVNTALNLLNLVFYGIVLFMYSPTV